MSAVTPGRSTIPIADLTAYLGGLFGVFGNVTLARPTAPMVRPEHTPWVIRQLTVIALAARVTGLASRALVLFGSRARSSAIS